MKKHAGARRASDGLDIPELSPGFFKNAVMGKYYARVMAKSNVVRIAPELSRAFPNEVAVNQALRELLRIRENLATITADRPVKRRKSA